MSNYLEKIFFRTDGIYIKKEGFDRPIKNYYYTEKYKKDGLEGLEKALLSSILLNEIYEPTDNTNVSDDVKLFFAAVREYRQDKALKDVHLVYKKIKESYELKNFNGVKFIDSNLLTERINRFKESYKTLFEKHPEFGFLEENVRFCELFLKEIKNSPTIFTPYDYISSIDIISFENEHTDFVLKNCTTLKEAFNYVEENIHNQILKKSAIEDIIKVWCEEERPVSDYHRDWLNNKGYDAAASFLDRYLDSKVSGSEIPRITKENNVTILNIIEDDDFFK